MPDNTLSTLGNIRTKIRRLTRNPSTAQITDDQIDEYINTFVLYDFPEHLRLFTLHETLTFYTQPNVAEYSTTDTPSTDPLFNFKNKYISVNGPAYVAGYQQFFSQSREQFFGMYPILRSIGATGLTGDGATLSFSGTLPVFPILQNNVLFNSINSSNDGLALYDVPVNSEGGFLFTPNDTVTARGVIDYITGAFTVIFPTPPDVGQPINYQVVPYVASLPLAILYFKDKFTLRPVPDQVYPVSIEAYRRPTELLDAGDMPELSEWWQYIAYGAAKKVFEDKMDIDSVQLIMAEFKQQERLILRRTLVQQSNDRSATIYTEQTNGALGSGFGFGGGGLV
jgi:hypothetical protein